MLVQIIFLVLKILNSLSWLDEGSDLVAVGEIGGEFSPW